MEYYSDEDILDHFDLGGFRKNKQKKVRRKGCVVGHLSSPIVEKDCYFILNNDIQYFKGCTRHYRIKNRIEKLGDVVHISKVTTNPIGWIQNWVREHPVKKGSEMFSVCLDSLANLVLHKANYLQPIARTDAGKAKVEAHTRGLIGKIRSGVSELLPDYLDMKKVEIIKDAICFKEIEEGSFIEYRGASVDPDVCLLRFCGQHVMCSTNLFLCALDKVQARFNLLFYCYLADKKEKYRGLSMLERVRYLITKFEALQGRMGDHFFKIPCLYEALIVGWVVADPEDLGCQGLFISQYEEAREILKEAGQDPDLINELLPRNRSEQEVRLHLELTGIIKSFGYPTLIAERMLDKIRENGTTTKHEIDMSLMDDIEGITRREICFNMFTKTGKFPLILSCPPELQSMLNNVPPSRRLAKDYSLWQRVRFQQNLNYDYSPDQGELIKDSAAALNLSAWAQMYDPCAFKVLYNKPPPPKEEVIYSPRVILQYLVSTPDEVKKLITERDNCIFRQEDQICVECQKECELQSDSGRAFTKQTPAQRLIQTSMEHNIATFVFPLVPEQSMVDSEIKNVFRNLQQVKHLQHEAQFINLDMKKWCLYQRHASNHFIGKIYDELFGLKTLFKNSHLFFTGCSVFSNNRLTPPNYDHRGHPIEGETFIQQYIGGMEGLHQKKWTHGIIMCIKLTAEKSDIKAEIMGQGDNQVIVLHFNKGDTNIDRKRENFLRLLEMNLRRMGHELKEKETWYSKFVHEYSKVRVYRGAAISYALKKASKVIPDINDGLFSIPSSISTINTITEAIAKADFDPDIAFIMNNFNVTNYLLRKNILSIRARELTILTYLNWPIDFGGLPISMYHSHAVRGNDDKVSLWLSILKTAKQTYKTLYEECIRVWVTTPESPAAEPLERRRLYEDIYSLNVKTAPSAENKIKDLVVEFLKSDDVTNPAIRVLYDTDKSAAYEEIIREVDKITPMFPQLAHELMKNSNAGLFIRLQGKLTRSKTLEQVVKPEGMTLIQMIERKNVEYCAFISRAFGKDNTYHNQLALNKSNCVTQQANILRKRSWDKELIGVTKAPWSNQVSIYSRDELECPTVGITIRISSEAIRNPAECHRMYGPLKNFIGAKTKEKITKKSTLSTTERSSYSTALMQVGKIRSWMLRIGDDHLVSLCNSIMLEKLPLCEGFNANMIQEDLLTSAVEGNLYHRFKSSVDRDTAMVNCLPSVTGHMEYCSDSMKGMTAGGVDYNVFFQYIYVACTQGLAMWGEISQHLEPSYMIAFNNCKCLEQTPNPELRMTRPPRLHIRSIVPDHMKVTRPSYRDTPEDIQADMAAVIGIKFGKNVDINYRKSHAFKELSGFSDSHGIDISLNDVRQLDLKVILTYMCLTSRHCRTLYRNRDNMLLCLSEDRSFHDVANSILHSEKIGNLLDTLKSKTNEHGGVTSVFGMSAYISKNIGNFFHEILMNFSQLTFVRFKDDSDDYLKQILEMLTLELRKLNRLSAVRKNHIINILNTTKNIRQANSFLALNIRRTRFTKDEVVAFWKSSARDLPLTQPYKFREIEVLKSRTIEFPLRDIVAYHSAREREQVNLLKVPQLSFLARPLGAISSAGGKIIEVLLATHLAGTLLDYTGYIYTLAEGSGSGAAVLASLFKNTTIVYNTWMRPDISHRDVVCDTSIPAFSDLRINPSRCILNHPLIIGETDITTPQFLKKARCFMADHPPFLVTMDAESPVETNNLQFLDSPIIPLASQFHAIYVVKLFHMFDLHPILTTKLQNLENYEWLIYKPIASNPVGPEIYLLLCPSHLVTEQFRDCKKMQRSIQSYVRNEMGMSTHTIDTYICNAREISKYLRLIFPDGGLEIPDKYNIKKGSVCSLYCNKFLDFLILMIDEIHSNVDNSLVHIATRSKGTNAMLFQLVHDLIFLLCYRRYDMSLSAVSYHLSLIKVNEDIGTARSNGEGYLSRTHPGFGDMWATWRDGRMYFREFGKMDKMCDCTPVLRIWTKDPNVVVNPVSMISWQIANELDRRDYFKCMDFYCLFRRESVNVSERVLENKVCNLAEPH